ncbi:DNA-binding FadR family transcriptional regulator [Neorhizobium galegae]|uniref:FadR/GntR family transcriptional regulator n=1 Tax=Neorhizobium galegae TaxID=399 RepID=UPI002782AC4A|nr:FCD domain-containing protein [Neorhizobium galegae]MDQ0137765.1 DNA-binding FadR family transcriptional regulator [Neorhizobium galegae]
MDHNNILLDRLRDYIVSSSQSREGRLPPERDLADQLGVSRGAIRKAMAVLEAEGSIWRHVGRGTFARRGTAIAAPSLSHIADHTSPPEAMEARMIVEPELARLAALRASVAQIAEMRRLSTSMREATSWAEYGEADQRFHNVIADAAGNRLMVEVARLIDGVRQTVVWSRLKLRPGGPASDYHSFNEHDAILEAIAARRRREAADAMRAHIESTARSLSDDIV